MLRLVSSNEPPVKLSNSFKEVMSRVIGITSEDRSVGEWQALLAIFRWITKDLENKVADAAIRQLKIVKGKENE